MKSARTLGPAGLCALLVIAMGVACSSDPDRVADAKAVAAIEPGSESMALIERSIAFHDPQGLWATGTFRLVQEATRPGGSDRVDELTVAAGGSRFVLSSERDGKAFNLEAEGDQVAVQVEGRQPTAKELEALRLDQAGSLRLRNYYVYLYGLPMKLKDPGALIDPAPKQVDLDGRATLEVRVAYAADVGSDVWYFNFDPETAELVGYRFYHDEEAQDGEYIVLDGLAEIDGLRLPARRAWYKFEQDEYLGTDTIRQGS